MIAYKAEAIENICQDFYNATGVNLSILDERFNPLPYRNNISNNSYCGYIQSTAEGNSRCRCSDELLLSKCRQSKKPEVHICHAGLIDIAIPILRDNSIIGYIIMGQIKNATNFQAVIPMVLPLCPNLKQLETIYDTLPYFDDDKVTSLANMAVMLAKYILLDKVLHTQRHRNLERVLEYLDAHIAEPIHINELAEKNFISKSTLYNLFATHLGCTISTYVNSRRIQLAKEALITTDLSIDEIARRCGFSGSTYFCRIFKQQTGLSPLQYRKQRR